MGYGDWVGGGGVYRVPTQPAAKRRVDSEAGPVRPCKGLEWVVNLQRPRTSGPTHSGPLVLRGPLRWSSSSKCRLWANKSEN